MEGLLSKLNKSRAELGRPALRQDGDLTVSAAARGREGKGRQQCVREGIHADASSKLVVVSPCDWTLITLS